MGRTIIGKSIYSIIDDIIDALNDGISIKAIAKSYGYHPKYVAQSVTAELDRRANGIERRVINTEEEIKLEPEQYPIQIGSIFFRFPPAKRMMSKDAPKNGTKKGDGCAKCVHLETCKVTVISDHCVRCEKPIQRDIQTSMPQQVGAKSVKASMKVHLK